MADEVARHGRLVVRNPVSLARPNAYQSESIMALDADQMRALDLDVNR